jgi:hypothetical protein
MITVEFQLAGHKVNPSCPDMWRVALVPSNINSVQYATDTSCYVWTRGGSKVEVEGNFDIVTEDIDAALRTEPLNLRR